VDRRARLVGGKELLYGEANDLNVVHPHSPTLRDNIERALGIIIDVTPGPVPHYRLERGQRHEHQHIERTVIQWVDGGNMC